MELILSGYHVQLNSSTSKGHPSIVTFVVLTADHMLTDANVGVTGLLADCAISTKAV